MFTDLVPYPFCLFLIVTKNDSYFCQLQSSSVSNPVAVATVMMSLSVHVPIHAAFPLLPPPSQLLSSSTTANVQLPKHQSGLLRMLLIDIGSRCCLFETHISRFFPFVFIPQSSSFFFCVSLYVNR